MIGVDTTFLIELELAELETHQGTMQLRDRLLDADELFVLTPQVISEFIHVVTDPKRFRRPATMSDALRRAEEWWSAREVIHAFPSDASTRLFLKWLGEHSLGRKRLLDTQLAATFWSAGIQRIVTSNRTDFRLLGFEVLSP